MAKLREFVRDPATAPQWVLASYRTMSATISGASGGRPMCLDLHVQKRAKPRRCHAITLAGFYDRERVRPSRPYAGDDDPEGEVDRAKRRARSVVPEHGELLPQHEDLHDQARAWAYGGDKRTEQGRDDR